MGLDVSHDCWSGSYTNFNRFRKALARAAGWTTEEKSDGEIRWDEPIIDWETLPEGCVEGEWSTPPSDHLLVILAHSDCDGLIHPREAGPLADRIERLIEVLPRYGNASDEWPRRARRFVDGLRRAVAANEDVEFQ